MAQLGPGDLCCLPEGARQVGTGLASAEGSGGLGQLTQAPVGSIYQAGPRRGASKPHFEFCLHEVKYLVHKDGDLSFDTLNSCRKPGMVMRVCNLSAGTAWGRKQEGPGDSLAS